MLQVSPWARLTRLARARAGPGGGARRRGLETRSGTAATGGVLCPLWCKLFFPPCVCVVSEPEQPRATECPHLEFLLSEPEGGGLPLPEMLAWWLEERLPVS